MDNVPNPFEESTNNITIVEFSADQGHPRVNLGSDLSAFVVQHMNSGFKFQFGSDVDEPAVALRLNVRLEHRSEVAVNLSVVLLPEQDGRWAGSSTVEQALATAAAADRFTIVSKPISLVPGYVVQTDWRGSVSE
jgi:hypothetical protein